MKEVSPQVESNEQAKKAEEVEEVEKVAEKMVTEGNYIFVMNY